MIEMRKVLLFVKFIERWWKLKELIQRGESNV